jgi:hypothetical protein
MLLLPALGLLVAGCLGPFKSTVALQDRGPDGGTVRVMSPVYPPDADTRRKVSEEMVGACRPRRWKVVDIQMKEIPTSGYAYSCPYDSCSGNNLQVDIRFVCNDG